MSGELEQTVEYFVTHRDESRVQELIEQLTEEGIQVLYQSKRSRHIGVALEKERMETLQDQGYTIQPIPRTHQFYQ